jgi:small subunit ribosomal protein S13
MEIAMTYIFGIGRPSSIKILTAAGVDLNKKSDDLNENDINRIREVMDKDFKVEGDLRRIYMMNIKRLVDIGCYRGTRHKKGLPVRGQRTHSNARTRKGKAVAIAGKKSVKTLK